MKLNSICIICNDPFLLMSLFTCLQMESIRDERDWNNDCNPFERMNILKIYTEYTYSMSFYNVKGVIEGDIYHLSKRNFDTVYISILETLHP